MLLCLKKKLFDQCVLLVLTFGCETLGIDCQNINKHRTLFFQHYETRQTAKCMCEEYHKSNWQGIEVAKRTDMKSTQRSKRTRVRRVENLLRVLLGTFIQQRMMNTYLIKNRLSTLYFKYLYDLHCIHRVEEFHVMACEVNFFELCPALLRRKYIILVEMRLTGNRMWP